MHMKKEILEMYFLKKMKTKDIAEKLNVSLPYITKIVRTDSRYAAEKEERKQISKIKHNKQIQRCVEEKRRKKRNNDYLILKEMHRQASMELSKNGKLSDRAYRDWNTSAYKYDVKKNRYEFREELGRSYDVKKYLKGSI